ncbi:MAG: hypothetical protein QXO48_03710 [Desulfurococcaceae archaeon]
MTGDIATLLAMVAVFALVDSVDPCIFMLFVSMLTSSALVNVKYALKIGCTFILSVYIGYVIFGLLLRYAALSLPAYLLVLVMVLYALTTLTMTLRREKSSEVVCRENDVPCWLINKLRLNTIPVNAVSAGIVGFIASFTLLPCSAGLYILYNYTTRNFGYELWIPLTLLYVFIFVLPLILIMLSIAGLVKRRGVYTALTKYEKQVKVAAAIVMLILAVHIYLTRI